ncbi:MAG: hypothetical protein K1563_07800 [Candidatus Thiodiazotropha sp. (ex. Lucinisca nassula)]|nr:hypothetical protein [Candidatus Thiodiazotropha sp. (ex. Lucinisca nassula)]MBW9273577.1 hypothetical protein [Candidatus Thiodiazotropha sp. (ex. Lucinisca nassula)]
MKWYITKFPPFRFAKPPYSVSIRNPQKGRKCGPQHGLSPKRRTEVEKQIEALTRRLEGGVS